MVSATDNPTGQLLFVICIRRWVFGMHEALGASENSMKWYKNNKFKRGDNAGAYLGKNYVHL